MIFLIIPLLIHFLGKLKAPEYLTRSKEVQTKKGRQHEGQQGI